MSSLDTLAQAHCLSDLSQVLWFPVIISLYNIIFLLKEKKSLHEANINETAFSYAKKAVPYIFRPRTCL